MCIGRALPLSAQRLILTIQIRLQKGCCEIQRILQSCLHPFSAWKRQNGFKSFLPGICWLPPIWLTQQKNADIARKKWYKNADEIAGFLHCVNHCWSEEKWKDMMYSHLEMTEKEATLRLNGKYTADINIFDDIENEAFKMADYMFCGIIKMCFL